MARDTTRTPGSQSASKTSSLGQSASSTASSALDTASSTIKDGVSRAKDEAARHGSAALDGIKEGAQALGSQAKEKADGYVEGGVNVVTQHLDDFAQAIRAASDELSQKDQTMAAQIVRQAAGGLESLSRSVSGTSVDDIISSVRRFGRNNPAAFVGGAVLVGLALGRFARASGHSAEDEWRQGGGSGQGGGYGGQSGYPGQGGQYGSGQYSSGQYGRGQYGGAGSGDERISPRPYSGSSSSVGGVGSSAGGSGASSTSSGGGGSPSQSQGYAGGGMSGSGATRQSGPSSATDESVTSSSSSTGGSSTGGSPGGLGSSSISTGENS